MRCGPNREINLERRLKSRTSQRSNEALAQGSSGSQTSIPRPVAPDSRHTCFKKGPINPAAPVIKTFTIEPRLRRYFPFRFCLGFPEPSDIVPVSRCLCTVRRRRTEKRPSQRDQPTIWLTAQSVLLLEVRLQFRRSIRTGNSKKWDHHNANPHKVVDDCLSL